MSAAERNSDYQEQREQELVPFAQWRAVHCQDAGKPGEGQSMHAEDSMQ